MSPEPHLPVDPLEALGDSIFLHVLSHLPNPTLATVTGVCKSWRQHSESHRSGIWRDACRRSGVDSDAIDLQVACENILEEPYDWRCDCVDLELWSRNRRFGRSRDLWRYKAGNMPGKIWQFRMNELGTFMITTNQDFGLQTICFHSSAVMFMMPAVRHRAHLEFCKGFVIFDPYQDTLHVFRTSMAVRTSTRKYSSARTLPDTAASSFSLGAKWSPDSALAPEYATHTAAEGRCPPEDIPREALAFYREIFPPTFCDIFRGRVDAKRTKAERAVLCSAGEGGVYLYDLEDDTSDPEVFRFPTGSQVGVKSLEMDDNYIFVSGIQQLHIFDRQTKQHILAYPPISPSLGDMCAAVYDITLAGPEAIPIDPRPPPFAMPPPPPAELQSAIGPSTNSISAMGRVDIPGYRSDAPRYSTVASATNGSTGRTPRDPSEEALSLTRQRGFLDCRCTSTDLVCATRGGYLLVVRDYKANLAIAHSATRERTWRQQTILVKLGKKIRLLATEATKGEYGDHITASTPKRIFFFDSNTLPSAEILQNLAATSSTSDGSASDGALPPIRVFCPLDITSREAESATCTETWDGNIYYSYTAQTDGRPPPLPSQMIQEWDRRNEAGPGLWLRAWDYNAYPEY